MAERSGPGGSADAGVPTGCTAASFNGHNYLLCSTLLAQPDAAAACASNGMRLARVDDATENQWIVNTLFGPVLPGDTVFNWIWIGGSDAVTEGSWLWPDGTLFYQNGPVGGLYNHWGQAEPNNARGGENCLALRVNYNWTDLQCTETHSTAASNGDDMTGRLEPSSPTHARRMSNPTTTLLRSSRSNGLSNRTALRSAACTRVCSSPNAVMRIIGVQPARRKASTMRSPLQTGMRMSETMRSNDSQGR